MKQYDPRTIDNYECHFKYHDVRYACHTVVQFKKEFVESFRCKVFGMGDREYMIDVQAKFVGRELQKDGTFLYKFVKQRYGLDYMWTYAPRFELKGEMLEDVIEEIVVPYLSDYVEPTEEDVLRDFDCPALILCWLILFVIYLLSFAFYEWYLLCFWATLFFYFFRKAALLEINKYYYYK